MDDEPSENDATKREGPGASARHLPKPLARGERVGRYVLEDPIGSGGMGVVYAATDPELVRKVAVKLVRPGGDSGSQARLLREAQAMARLQHPNVVAVHDVGVFGNRVFIAMELVEGETLRKWLAREKRSWRTVLGVFRDAGRGLVAAHAARMVHRDFKLDNVLIGTDGRARVMDFGLAREVGEVPASRDSPSSLTSQLTQDGSIVGTPAYMAPEQRSRDGVVDARTDQFSFCVSLYEALYGERPFDKAGKLREAPASSTVPAWIRRVILRGLEHEQTARWASMAELLGALDRDPAAQRRRIAIAAVAVLGAGGAVAAILATRSSAPSCGEIADTAFGAAWNEARKAEMRAAFEKTGVPFGKSLDTTARNLDAHAVAWRAARTEACRSKQTEDTLLRITCLEHQRARLKSLVDLLVRADDKIIDLAVQATSTLEPPSDCADVRTLGRSAKLPDDPSVRAEIESLRIEVSAVSALPAVGLPKDALAKLVPICNRAKAIGYKPLEAEAFLALSFAQDRQSQSKDSLASAEHATFAAEASGMDRVAVRASALAAATAALNSRIPEARIWIDRAKAGLERLGGDRALGALVEFARGIVLHAAGEYESAIAAKAKAVELRIQQFGPDHFETLIARGNLGSSYDDLAQPQKALVEQRAAIAGIESTLGPDNQRLAIMLANLGLVYMRTGQLADADAALERALRIAKATVGPKTRKMAIVLVDIAMLRLEQKRFEDALARAKEAADEFTAAAGERSDGVGRALVVQGEALFALGKPGEAAPLVERGIAIRDAINPSLVALAQNLTSLAEIRLALGKPAEALAACERALEISKQARYPGELARTRYVTALALVASKGDRARAKQLAREARDELAPLTYRADLLAAVDALLAKL